MRLHTTHESLWAVNWKDIDDYMMIAVAAGAFFALVWWCWS